MRKIIGIISLVLMSAFPALAQNEAVQVNNGQTVKIDRHQTCRMVTNAGSTPFMVATMSAPEWSTGNNSFINVLPPDVILDPCYDNMCPIGSENYRRRHSFHLAAVDISVQEDFMFGTRDIYVYGNSGPFSLWENNNGTWSRTRDYTAVASGALPLISGFGDRTLAIRPMRANENLSFWEINKTSSGFSNAAAHSVTNLPKFSRNITMGFSNLNDEGDTFYAYPWNFIHEGGNEVHPEDWTITLDSIYRVTKNSDGSWSRGGVLSLPSLNRLSVISVTQFGSGDQVYAHGYYTTNNERRRWGTVFRKNGSSWVQHQNFRGNAPFSVSRNGLFAYSAAGLGLMINSPGYFYSWRPNSLDGTFSELPTVTVNNPSNSAQKCCMSIPVASYDGRTVYTMTGGIWLDGGGVQAFRFNGSRFVNAGITIFDRNGNYDMQDSPTRSLNVGGSGKWFTVTQQSGGSNAVLRLVMGRGC